MNHVTIEEENVVERYLMGQLAVAEATEFEEHYLECAECLDKLELSKRLHDGLKDVAAEEGSRLVQTAFLAWLVGRGRAGLSRHGRAGLSRHGRAGLSRHRGAVQATLAVVFLGVVILPWLLNHRLQGELAGALAPQGRTPTYVLSPERSGPTTESSTRVTLRSAPEWVVLTMQLPPQVSSAQCRVDLREAAGSEPLWQGPLESDASGRVTLNVHSTWLEASDYVLELDVLTSEGESQPAVRFAFRVRREE